MASLFTTLGQYFWKISNMHVFIYIFVGFIFYAIGAAGMLYVASAILNIIVLKFLALSVVLPMTAITYIWSMVIARVILKEKVTKYKLIGVASIIAGAIFIGNS